MKYFKNIALALVAFVFVACGGSQSPSEVAKEFMQIVTKDNFDPKSEELKKYSSLKLQNIFSKISVNKNSAGNMSVKDITIDKEEQINDIVKIYYTITFDNGKKESNTLTMIKENDRYVVDDIFNGQLK